MDNEKMIENIRSLCKSIDISPTRLESDLGFSQGLISRWKDKSPSIDKIVDIADYFNVPIDEIVGRSKKYDSNKSVVDGLIYFTKENKIEWDSINFASQLPNSYEEIEDHIGRINLSDFPYADTRKYTFITKYKKGFFTLQSYLIYMENAIIDSDCALYIQADKKSMPVYQNCNQEQLRTLTKEVLKAVYETVPEIEADEFKKEFTNNFIKNSMQNQNEVISNIKIPNSKELGDMLNSIWATDKNEPDNNSKEIMRKYFLNPKMIELTQSLVEIQEYLKKNNK